MHNIFSAYQSLVTSSAQLMLCKEAASVGQLLAQLKQCWQQEDMTDENLLAHLHACNQQPLAVRGDLLAQHWIPYRYDARSRSIFWCLPGGRATEPFHDQFISRCRQGILLNQLMVPRTQLSLIEPVHTVFQPAGFVFHLSRCGSTLVSGSFAEIEHASVLSESQLLTDVLLDSTLSDNEKQQCLPTLIRWQGEGGKTGMQQVLIKWNAWDIFCWPIIRALYPHIPVVLLVRNPEEILASHARQSGRHMSGDPSMASVHQVFNAAGTSLLDFRIRVLGALQQAMLNISADACVMIVDYRQLNSAGIQRISEHFGVIPGIEELNCIQQRMQWHSKEPERQFTPDSSQKRQVFDQNEQNRIRQHLLPAFQELLLRAETSGAEFDQCLN